EKGCASKSSYLAEVAWRPKLRRNSEHVYFRPVAIAGTLECEQKSQRPLLRLRRVEGITCRELACRVQEAARTSLGHDEIYGEVLGAIGFQALQALMEFRAQGSQVSDIRRHLRKYAWPSKLKAAIYECARFITKDRNRVSGCLADIELLGRDL